MVPLSPTPMQVCVPGTHETALSCPKFVGPEFQVVPPSVVVISPLLAVTPTQNMGSPQLMLNTAVSSCWRVQCAPPSVVAMTGPLSPAAKHATAVGQLTVSIAVPFGPGFCQLHVPPGAIAASARALAERSCVLAVCGVEVRGLAAADAGMGQATLAPTSAATNRSLRLFLPKTLPEPARY